MTKVELSDEDIKFITREDGPTHPEEYIVEVWRKVDKEWDTREKGGVRASDFKIPKAQALRILDDFKKTCGPSALMIWMNSAPGAY